MGKNTSLYEKAGSALSRLQGTLHKHVKGFYRLKDFIRMLRRCKTRADERSLLSKEAAGIRTALKQDISPDQKWHSIAKLLYMHLQGMQVHYGQVECMKMVAGAMGSKSTMRGRSALNVKRLGYLGASLLTDEQQQTLYLMCNTWKMDLDGSADDTHVCAALNCLAALPSTELYLELSDHVYRLAIGDSALNVKKRALTCLSVMIERVPELAELFSKHEDLLIKLLNGKEHSLQLASCYIVESLLQSKEKYLEFTPIASIMSSTLLSLIAGQSEEYMINDICDPNLQISLLRCIGLMRVCNDDIQGNLERFVTLLVTTKNKSNAMFAVLYEGLLTISALYENYVFCVGHLGAFLERDDMNLKFVALELLDKMSSAPAALPAITKHRALILQCTSRAGQEDPSILQIAVKLSLCLIVNKETLLVVLPELLSIPDSELLPDPLYCQRLLEECCKWLDGLERIQKSIRVLNRFCPNADSFRESMVFNVVQHINQSYPLKISECLNEASMEVYIWTIGQFTDSCSKLLEAFDCSRQYHTDELFMGYFISAGGKLSGRGVDCYELFEKLATHKEVSNSVRERAAQMKEWCGNEVILSLCFDSTDLSAHGDVSANARIHGNGINGILSKEQKVFEGNGMQVHMKKTHPEESSTDTVIDITITNIIKHPAQLTTDCELQVAVPKGLTCALNPASGTQARPFGGTISQRAVVSGADGERVKLRCKFMFKPAASKTLLTETFNCTL